MSILLRTTRLALLLAIALASAFASADSWQYHATISSKTDTHGDVTIRRVLDARKDRQYPNFSVEVSRGKELLARFPGVYFEQLFAAPDGSFFVALSNDGLPGTAVLIFDREGNLRLEAKHDVAYFDYCGHSVTRQRLWFDAETPGVKFVKHEDIDAYRVRLRNCHGREVDLLTTVQEAYKKSFERKALGVR
jgi:hypothetical protein